LHPETNQPTDAWTYFYLKFPEKPWEVKKEKKKKKKKKNLQIEDSLKE
jgi:hypothetical protein